MNIFLKNKDNNNTYSVDIIGILAQNTTDREKYDICLEISQTEFFELLHCLSLDIDLRSINLDRWNHLKRVLQNTILAKLNISVNEKK